MTRTIMAVTYGLMAVAMARLGRNPSIADLHITRASVLFDLSVATAAAPALSERSRNACTVGPNTETRCRPS